MMFAYGRVSPQVNGLQPDFRQDAIDTNAGVLLVNRFVTLATFGRVSAW